jgi:hypothetical protein
MTELNIAYNTTDLLGEDLSKNNVDNDYEQESQQSQQPLLQQTQSQIQIQPQQQPIIQPQIQSPPQQMNNYFMPQQQQPIIRKQYQQPHRTPEYSFWDRMTMSRPDVFKLVLLSFVIVLGISIEKFASHYITSYLTDNILSPIQEVLVRLSYPILIFLFIWIIKSL